MQLNVLPLRKTKVMLNRESERATEAFAEIKEAGFLSTALPTDFLGLDKY